MLLITLLAAPFALAEESHLAQMQRQHGWQTVAAVVRSSDQGDMTISDVHARLRELGLQDLSMTVNGAGKGVPSKMALTECGWNQGVFCQMTLPAGSANELTVTCATKAGPVAQVSLTATMSGNPVPDQPRIVHVGDLLPCWATGGDRLVVTAGLPTAKAALALTVQGVEIDVVNRALAPSVAGIQSCAPGEVTIETDEDGRLTVLKMERGGVLDPEATACIQDVLAKFRLEGAAKVGITLVAH